MSPIFISPFISYKAHYTLVSFLDQVEPVRLRSLFISIVEYKYFDIYVSYFPFIIKSY